jgi:DnaK suppressor protein
MVDLAAPGVMTIGYGAPPPIAPNFQAPLRPLPSSDRVGVDTANQLSLSLEQAIEMALKNNARDLLEQNERAIARIDTGTYGICESCGKAIGKARLQAFPRATLCVTCKQREERR